MYMVIGLKSGLTNLTELIRTWLVTWSFNLLGSFLLAVLFVIGGGGALVSEQGVALLNKAVAYKMNSNAVSLVARAVLCNWLVCLALWMALRTASDGAKAIVIFWCLFAFIASGYEHSVANMTLLSLGLLIQPTVDISVSGMTHNLLWVTLGNAIGGALFLALGYWQKIDLNERS